MKIYDGRKGIMARDDHAKGVIIKEAGDIIAKLENGSIADPEVHGAGILLLLRMVIPMYDENVVSQEECDARCASCRAEVATSMKNAILEHEKEEQRENLQEAARAAVAEAEANRLRAEKAELAVQAARAEAEAANQEAGQAISKSKGWFSLGPVRWEGPVTVLGVTAVIFLYLVGKGNNWW